MICCATLQRACCEGRWLFEFRRTGSDWNSTREAGPKMAIVARKMHRGNTYLVERQKRKGHASQGTARREGGVP
eukprot:1158537-Pelagomonas_calceolata.AAC.19